jgi:hypothetical protein
VCAMSIYAYLTCSDCQQIIWLGKTVFHNQKPSYFHIGNESPVTGLPPDVRNQAVWKFLAEHSGHALCVVNEGDERFETICEFVEIGGDELGSIPFADYLKDWPPRSS